MTSILVRYWENSLPAYALLAAALVLFAVVGVRLSVIDIRSHRLPNRIIFPACPAAAALLGTAAALAGEWGRLLSLAGGGAALWLAYFGLRAAYPAGMGFGDVKLAGLLGVYLGFAGWAHLVWGTFAAFVLGGLWALLLIASRRGGATSAIPFGPFMIGGAALALAALG